MIPLCQHPEVINSREPFASANLDSSSRSLPLATGRTRRTESLQDFHPGSCQEPRPCIPKIVPNYVLVDHRHLPVGPIKRHILALLLSATRIDMCLRRSRGQRLGIVAGPHNKTCIGRVGEYALPKERQYTMYSVSPAALAGVWNSRSHRCSRQLSAQACFPFDIAREDHCS